MNTKLTMLAVLAAGILASTSQHVAGTSKSTARRHRDATGGGTAEPDFHAQRQPACHDDPDDWPDRPGSGRQRDEREREGQGRA